MISLLHGENVVASRTVLTEMTLNKDVEIIRIQGRNSDLTTILQALQSESLFGLKKLIVFENILSSIGKKSKTNLDFIHHLLESGKQNDIIVWEEKEIPKSILRQFGQGSKEQIFKHPQVLFQFLDALAPRQSNHMLNLFQQTIDHSAVEVVYLLLTRRIRHLLLIKEGNSPKELADWQIGRLTSQAKLFTMVQLRRMHTDVIELEYSFKSGKSPFTFYQLLEQFLLNI